MKYASAPAFRDALEQRLRTQTRESGVSLMRLRKRVAFERFLARLVVAAPDRWVLKGAFALDVRLGLRTRATRDIDLARADDEQAATADLVAAATVDLGDFFVFEAQRTPALDAAAGFHAVRYTVLCELAGRRFEQFPVDVALAETPALPPEPMRMTDLLSFAEVAAPELPVVALEQHIAEKLHAYTGRYGTGERESTRTKEIVTMQCGPIRHRIASAEGPAGELALELEVRETDHAIAAAAEMPIQGVFRLLIEDETRTALVCEDVLEALAEGRRCLVLSQWKEHCHLLAESLRTRGASPLVLEGGLGKRARDAIIERIENTSHDEPLVVVATGQYLGEGFDCPQLDTLFLAFPVSFKGRLVQYTGRLMRANDGKTGVRVYDYADVGVPVLRAMHVRRLATYKSLGFTRGQPALTAAASV